MDTKDNIYLDYAATTPVDPRVLEAMIPYFSEIFGNPSSIHKFGQQAEAILENGREGIANDLNCDSEEIIFTSCGTESDNLAIRGIAFEQRKKTGANHLLVSPVEHAAVLRTVQQLHHDFKFEIEYLPVDSFGMVDPEDVLKRIRKETALVSVIFANNEIGTINPINEIGAICNQYGVPFHTDAVQAAAYLNIDFKVLPVDLMAFGAHKMYGPKGVGALFIRKGTRILPILTGGKQEAGYRSGTQNVPYIVGLAKALHLAQEEMIQRTNHVLPLRNILIETILNTIPSSWLTGHPSHRLPNHASFVFEGIDGNELLMMLDIAGFACSSGSACKTGDPEPSSVLTAIGLSSHLALGSLRITLGNGTTLEQIEKLLKVLPMLIDRCRKS